MLSLSCCRRLSRVQPRSVKSSFHLVGSTVAQRSGDISLIIPSLKVISWYNRGSFINNISHKWTIPGNFGAVVACFASGALGKLGHLVFAGVIATVFYIYTMML